MFMRYNQMLFLWIYIFLSACSAQEATSVQQQNTLWKQKATEAFAFCKVNNLDTTACFLIDFALPSGKNRMVLWDFTKQQIQIQTLCTHGACNNLPANQDQLSYSNLPNSHCSSLGKYRVGNRAYSNWGINIHYKLHGLEKTNDQAFNRVIVFHSWDAVPNKEVYPKEIVKSWGCPAVSDSVMLLFDAQLKEKKQDYLLWIFDSNFAETVGENTLATAAEELCLQKVVYDPSYFSIPYPMGDVPAGKGVCTDVVIRAYRKLGIDLQQLVHEDMRANFVKYPNNWGLNKPDKNIDHRRVPNLMQFFERFGEVLPISNDPTLYQPGDIVCWDLGGGVTHIGIISNQFTPNGNTPLVVHNVGSGQVMEDVLFKYFKIIGHYRYE